MTCVIVQSSYIPWRGYFDLIRRADTFVFLDDVQFTRRDWRTRNFIKSHQGPSLLAVPVQAPNHHSLRICDVRIDTTTHWARKHLRSIEQAYARAPFRDLMLELVADVYANPPEMLHQLNRELTIRLWRAFSGNAPRRFVGVEELPGSEAHGDRSARLAEICRAVGETTYLSGPSAQCYTDAQTFAARGVSIDYIDYDYAPYTQIHGAFAPQLSLLDVLMNLGPCCIDEALKPGALILPQSA